MELHDKKNLPVEISAMQAELVKDDKKQKEIDMDNEDWDDEEENKINSNSKQQNDLIESDNDSFDEGDIKD